MLPFSHDHRQLHYRDAPIRRQMGDGAEHKLLRDDLGRAEQTHFVNRPSIVGHASSADQTLLSAKILINLHGMPLQTDETLPQKRGSSHRIYHLMVDKMGR